MVRFTAAGTRVAGYPQDTRTAAGYGQQTANDGYAQSYSSYDYSGANYSAAVDAQPGGYGRGGPVAAGQARGGAVYNYAPPP